MPGLARRGAVEAVHGAVKGGVRGAQGGRHQDAITEGGEGRAGMGGTGVEDGLGKTGEFGKVFGGREGEGVVDEADGTDRIRKN